MDIQILLQYNSRGSIQVGLKDSRISGVEKAFYQISRNLSVNTNARLSNLILSGFDFEEHYKNIDQDPDLQRKILLIQARAKAWIQGRKYKKLLRKAKYRLRVIQELVVTEENYVIYEPLMMQSRHENDREDMVQYQALPPQILQQLHEVEIRQEDVENIFSNLESIIEINSQFAQTMREKIPNTWGQFANICVDYAPRLKIYVNYLNNYENATQTLDKLKANNPKFQNYRVYTENNQLNGHDLQDYLIKPVQRLPKYVLLLKDLLKNTDPTHRDYENVQTALNKFNEVCSHNNEQMDFFIRENKKVELHRKFCKPQQKNNSSNSNSADQNQISSQNSLSTPQKEQRSKTLFQKGHNRNSSVSNNTDANLNCDLQIIQQGVYREFLWEETLSLFLNDTQRVVKVYFLTDLILVSVKVPQEKKENLLKYLQLNEASFYKNMSDLKYFSNLFRISGKNESLTFICESDESKSNLISRINKQILIPLKLKVQQKVVKKQEKLLQQQQQLHEQQNKLNSPNDTSNILLNQGSLITNGSQQNNSESIDNSNQKDFKNENNLETGNDDVQFPIQVTVLGTEERASSNKLKELFTVYVSEIQIGENIKQKIFVRYSEMISLKEFVQKNIKQITGFEDLPRNFFTHHKTKVIEKRKILIENFLQKLLTHQGLQYHPQCSYILSFLNLPENFYSLPLNIGESNFDFLNNIESTNNTNVRSSLQEQSDESEQEEDSFVYENGQEDDRCEEIKNKMRQISVGASNFLNKNKLNMKIQLQNNNDLSFSQHQSSINQEDENDISQNNLKINDSIDFSMISLPNSLTNSGIKSGNQGSNNTSQVHISTNLSGSQQQINFNNTSSDEKEVEVFTEDQKSYKINITRYTKALDICETVSKKIGLVSFLDFRLYLEDDKKNIRFLDDDEPIFKIIFKQEFKNTELEMKGKDKDSSLIALKSLKNSFLNKIGFKHKYKYKIKFCKYLWLQKDLEEFDYKSDPVRLQLIASQILNYISLMKFTLDIKDYYLYSALYLFIYHPDIIDEATKDNSSKNVKANVYQKIKEFLPTVIIKQCKENMWVENLYVYIDTISEELSFAVKASKQIIRDSYNASSPPSNQSSDNINIYFQSSSGDAETGTEQPNLVLQIGTSQNQSQDHGDSTMSTLFNNSSNSLPGTGHLQQINQIILTDKKKVACMVLLNTFKQNSLYGATLFYCETYRKTIKDAKQLGLIIPQNVYCCIKCDSIQILDSSKSKKIKSFVYSDIKETKVFPSSITFILRNEPNAYRFDTTQSFEISQLLSAYNHIMMDIEKNTLTLDEEYTKLRVLKDTSQISLTKQYSANKDKQYASPNQDTY